MIKPTENFVQAESRGKFALWLNRPIYKIYKTDRGYVKNTRTGENMGKELTLHIHYHDEFNRPLGGYVCDEDCYEFAEEDYE